MATGYGSKSERSLHTWASLIWITCGGRSAWCRLSFRPGGPRASGRDRHFRHRHRPGVSAVGGREDLLVLAGRPPSGGVLRLDGHAVVGVKELEVDAPGSEGQVRLNKRPAVATVDGSIEPIPCRLTVLPARLSREQPPGAAVHVVESLPATACWPRWQDLPAVSAIGGRQKIRAGRRGRGVHLR